MLKSNRGFSFRVCATDNTAAAGELPDCAEALFSASVAALGSIESAIARGTAARGIASESPAGEAFGVTPPPEKLPFAPFALGVTVGWAATRPGPMVFEADAGLEVYAASSRGFAGSAVDFVEGCGSDENAASSALFISSASPADGGAASEKLG